jgi:hypothetical protein
MIVRNVHWAETTRGIKRFVYAGWSGKAALLGWTAAELYHVPPRWSRIDLTGAALLIGDRQGIAVTSDSIVIGPAHGSNSAVSVGSIWHDRAPARLQKEQRH